MRGKYRGTMVLALLLVPLLLTGCGAPAGIDSPAAAPSVQSGSPLPAVSPAPTGSPVTVHWDVLEDREAYGSTAKYLPGGAMEDFVPGEYGTLVPYIGAEQVVDQGYENEDGSPHYEANYCCGLCTTDGTILTGPVYSSAYRLSWYDTTGDDSRPLPVWVVSRTLQDESQKDNEWTRGYYTAVGLVAEDGSWYTGCRYRSDVTSTIAVSPYSILMMEDKDNAVLISVADGSELARYAPADFIGAEDPDGLSEWLFADGLQWGAVRCVGDYFYFDPATVSDTLTKGPVWIDSRTGAFLGEAPMELPEYQYAGKITFDGGWYQGGEENYQNGGDLELHYDDGAEKSIHLTGEFGALSVVSSQYLLFCRTEDEAGEASCTLTDHSLNVLYTVQGNDYSMALWPDGVTGARYPVVTQIVDWNTNASFNTVLDSRGQPLASSNAYIAIDNGFASLVDENVYRLVELSGDGCREIFRLPRWS